MKTRWLSWGLALLGAGLLAGSAQAQYQLLHSFSGGATEADQPRCTLLASNGWLYGTAYAGGISNAGVVFALRPDGSGYTNLHHFVGGATDGHTPFDGLLASTIRPRLFGTTTQGGISNLGVVYALNMDGTGYTNLHHFVGGATDGQLPRGALTLSGTRLLGTAAQGGSSNAGVVFALNADGTGYTNLHSFSSADGSTPQSSLLLRGTQLYGLAANGGVSNCGTLFALNPDGSGFTNLHHFTGGTNDGQAPFGALVGDTTKLYGMTLWGGPENGGVVFSLKPDGSGYTNLHMFLESTGDGLSPFGTPTLVGPRLFGLTFQGGSASGGVLFCLHVDGSGYTNLHNFSGGTGDGQYPLTSLTVYGGRIFGVTSQGGSASSGAAFALDVTEPQLYFQTSDGLLASWILNTSGTFQVARILANTGGWQLKAAGDIDGDGVADLLFQTASGDTGGWFMKVDGTTRDARFWWNTGTWELRACADYDGDGLGEVFFQTPDGSAALWHLDRTGAFQSAELLGNQGAWKLKAALDLDRDHKAELFWQTSAGVVAIWFHNPDASIRAYVVGSTSEWDLRAAVDVDGDGVGDLAWQTPDSRVGGWFMNTNGTARAGSYWWPTGGWKLKAAGR